MPYFQAWLEDYQKKVKEVAGIKEEPEGSLQTEPAQTVEDTIAKPAVPAELSAKGTNPFNYWTAKISAHIRGRPFLMLKYWAAEDEEKLPEPPNDRRLWLYGSTETSPGAPGLFKTARTEPLGERLRLLYQANKSLAPSTGLPADLAGRWTQLLKSQLQRILCCHHICDITGALLIELLRDAKDVVRAAVESMLAQAVALDLTVNIFKDGLWGCYRCCLFKCCMSLISHGMFLREGACRLEHSLMQFGVLFFRKTSTPADAVLCPAEHAPAGSHMEIGNYGDLNTLHWVQNRPISHPDLVHCAVTYGIASCHSLQRISSKA